MADDLEALAAVTSGWSGGFKATRVLGRTGWESLFPQMVHRDAAHRDEARAVFGAIATPNEHARFASHLSTMSFWGRLLNCFRR